MLKRLLLALISDKAMMNHKEFAAIRASLGLTQFELADVLGVTGRYVGNLERGVSPIKPTVEMAMRYLLIARPSKKNLGEHKNED